MTEWIAFATLILTAIGSAILGTARWFTNRMRELETDLRAAHAREVSSLTDQLNDVKGRLAKRSEQLEASDARADEAAERASRSALESAELRGELKRIEADLARRDVKE